MFHEGNLNLIQSFNVKTGRKYIECLSFNSYCRFKYYLWDIIIIILGANKVNLTGFYCRDKMFTSVLPVYLLVVLCSWSSLNILFKSTPTEFSVSGAGGGCWLVGVSPGFSEEETTVSVVLPTAWLGGKVLGRRSGRPDCMTGWDRRKSCQHRVVK